MSGQALPAERTFRGIPVSHGVCHGRVVVIGKPHDVHVPRYQLADREPADELERIQRALTQTRKELDDIQAHVSQAMGSEHARIFDAQQLFLEDPVVLGSRNYVNEVFAQYRDRFGPPETKWSPGDARRGNPGPVEHAAGFESGCRGVRGLRVHRRKEGRI